MKPMQIIVLVTLTAIVASMAHAWCYEDSFLGGHIPFALTTLAPIIGALIGFRAGRQKGMSDAEAYVQINLRKTA